MTANLLIAVLSIQNAKYVFCIAVVFCVLPVRRLAYCRSPRRWHSSTLWNRTQPETTLVTPQHIVPPNIVGGCLIQDFAVFFGFQIAPFYRTNKVSPGKGIQEV